MLIHIRGLYLSSIPSRAISHWEKESGMIRAMIDVTGRIKDQTHDLVSVG